jgi:lysozyme family protein
VTTFDLAWRITLHEEGGRNPDDAGSETYYGIRRADNPDLPWPPTLEQAKARAEAQYWAPYHFELLPPIFAVAAFDWLFNGGPAIRTLQALLDVPLDGEIGPQTAAAAAAVKDPVELLARYLTRRAIYYAGLSTFAVNAGEWFARLFHVHRACLALPKGDG